MSFQRLKKDWSGGVAKRKMLSMIHSENLKKEHQKNIDRGLTFEASDEQDTTEKPAAETQEDEQPESKARVRRHPNRKRVVRPSRNKKERLRHTQTESTTAIL